MNSPLSDAQMPELLPCPFCGKHGTAVIGRASEQMWDEESGPYPHTESYAVLCNAAQPDGPGGCGASGGYFTTEAEAIAAWNRRSAFLAGSAVPVAVVTNKFGDPEAFAERGLKVLADIQKLPIGTKFYATPIPADSDHSGATDAALTEAYAEGRKDQAEEDSKLCPRCKGSGEQEYLVGGGPDAHDEIGPCGRCAGRGEVTYTDGTKATGSPPLPPHSPRQQLMLQHIDVIEAMLGGANGPTIQLRAYVNAPPIAGRTEPVYDDSILFEGGDPVEGMDKIYADYATTFGKLPDAHMAQVVAQTKERLLVWWHTHRVEIRAALAATPDRSVGESPSDLLERTLANIQDYRPDARGPLAGMVRGGEYVKVSELRSEYAHLAADRSARGGDAWNYEDVPEVGTTCLVWSKQRWEKTPSYKIDTWDEQHEAPVSFSSATIPVGPGWDAHDDWTDVICWRALAADRSARGGVPEGWRLLKDTTPDERQWHEDASHENGNYYNTCVTCLRQFIGHKRRAACKACDSAAAIAASPAAGQEGK